MLLPASTGSGASAADRLRTGAEATVVVIAAPVTGAVWSESIDGAPLVIRVPLASGLATRMTIWTEPEAPASSGPMVQVTVPAAYVPPPVADTKVVFAGTGAVRTAPLAAALPVLE